MTQTVEQRRANLELANRVRVFRAELKAKIAARHISASTVLRRPVPSAEGMCVRDLLLASPGIGQRRAEQLLRRCQIDPSRRIGALTARQRGELALRLREMER